MPVFGCGRRAGCRGRCSGKRAHGRPHTVTLLKIRVCYLGRSGWCVLADRRLADATAGAGSTVEPIDLAIGRAGGRATDTVHLRFADFRITRGPNDRDDPLWQRCPSLARGQPRGVFTARRNIHYGGGEPARHARPAAGHTDGPVTPVRLRPVPDSSRSYGRVATLETEIVAVHTLRTRCRGTPVASGTRAAGWR